MTTDDKLPQRAYFPNDLHCKGPQGEPPVIAVERGEVGYWPVYTNRTADELNEPLGITQDQLDAMLHGSMFGWDTPGADPEWHRKLRERNEPKPPYRPELARADRLLTASELQEKYSTEFNNGEHPQYLRRDWRHDVAEDITLLGYWQWVEARLDEEE